MTLDLGTLPPLQRRRVRKAYQRAEEDAQLARAYDALLAEHGCVNVLDEVAEQFTEAWGKRVTRSRVRTAKWGK